MAKIRLLDILQKDHGTGPISLVQEMERSVGKGKIRLLDQVRRRGKDNEVLVRYHVPELKEERNRLEEERDHLGDLANDLNNDRDLLENRLDYSTRKIEQMKEEKIMAKIEGKKIGFLKGLKLALRDTLMHRVDVPMVKGFKGPIYYSPDAMDFMCEDIVLRPEMYTYKTQNNKTIPAKGIEGGDLEDFIRGVKNSKHKAQKEGKLDKRQFPLYAQKGGAEGTTATLITHPLLISDLLRKYFPDPAIVLPPHKYKYH